MSKKIRADLDPRDLRFGRDENGQFKKGFSGNLGGRPPKLPFADPTDFCVYGEGLVNVIVDGKRKQLSRRMALRNKLYETAMKGGVMAQIRLEKQFQEVDMARAAVQMRINDIEERYFDSLEGGEMPDDVQREYVRLQNLLTYGDFDRGIQREAKKRGELQRRQTWLRRKRRELTNKSPNSDE